MPLAPLRAALVADRYRIDTRLLARDGPALAVDALAAEGRAVRLLRVPHHRLPALRQLVAAWDAAAGAGLPVVPVRAMVDDVAVGPVLVLEAPSLRRLRPGGAAAEVAAQARVYGAALVAAGVPVDRLTAADLGLDDAGSLVLHTPPWRAGDAARRDDAAVVDAAARVDRLVAVVQEACGPAAPAGDPTSRASRRRWRRAASRHRAAVPPAPGGVEDERGAEDAGAPDAGDGRHGGIPAAPDEGRAELVRRVGVPARRPLRALRAACLALTALLVVVLLLDDPLTPTGSAAPGTTDAPPAASTAATDGSGTGVAAPALGRAESHAAAAPAEPTGAAAGARRSGVATRRAAEALGRAARRASTRASPGPRAALRGPAVPTARRHGGARDDRRRSGAVIRAEPRSPAVHPVRRAAPAPLPTDGGLLSGPGLGG